MKHMIRLLGYCALPALLFFLLISFVFQGARSNTDAAKAADEAYFAANKHFETIAEADTFFEDRLPLLELAENQPEGTYEQAILTITEGGDFADPDAWEMLDVSLNQSGKAAIQDADHLNLTVFFDPQHPSIHGGRGSHDAEFAEAEQVFTEVIHGTEVTWVEPNHSTYPYSLKARFTYNGWPCYLSAFSNQDPDLLWNTLDYILAE